MSAFETPNPQSLIARVQNILLRPKDEWAVLANEPATVQSLMMYAAILAVLPLLGGLVGSILLGGLFGGMGIIAALIRGVIGGVVGYVLNLGLVYVLSLIINALAPSFGAQSDPIQALKVSVYSGTPGWVAGIFSGIPGINVLVSLAALGYTCYILYLGVTEVLRPPQDKAAGFTIVVILCEIGLAIAVGTILAIVAAVAVLVVGATVLSAAHTY